MNRRALLSLALLGGCAPAAPPSNASVRGFVVRMETVLETIERESADVAAELAEARAALGVLATVSAGPEPITEDEARALLRRFAGAYRRLWDAWRKVVTGVALDQVPSPDDVDADAKGGA